MKHLKKEFYGKGEVSGYRFRQVGRTSRVYIYEVTHNDVESLHYEVFLHKENQRFGTVSYPRSNAFGSWAWTYPTLELAREKMAEIHRTKKHRNLRYIHRVFAPKIMK